MQIIMYSNQNVFIDSPQSTQLDRRNSTYKEAVEKLGFNTVQTNFRFICSRSFHVLLFISLTSREFFLAY